MAARSCSPRRTASPRASSRFRRGAVLSPAGRLRRRVIGEHRSSVRSRPALRVGWDAIIDSDGLFVGMHSFGASAPYQVSTQHFGITAEAVADAVVKKHNG